MLPQARATIKYGSAEPSTWQVNVADSTAVLQAAGNVGLRGFLNSSTTNYPIVLSWDDLLITQVRPTALRSIAYSYDGLERLLTATETGATSNVYGYTYDKVGNRLTSTVNGTTTTRTYDKAYQITNAGYSYDNAGNLINDGTSAYAYDALGRMTSLTTGGNTRTNSYNGDGVLVADQVGSATGYYTQDLAAPLSQVLAITNWTAYEQIQYFIYGMERLQRIGSPTSWYVHDPLNSVRATMDDAGSVSPPTNYDPWGQIQSGSVPIFGYTGELQQGSNVYLRARWYHAAVGSFGSRDPFAGMPEMPYSQHYFQYGYSNPVSNRDPSGRMVQAATARVTYSTRPGAAAVTPLRLPKELDCYKDAPGTITLEFDDLGVILGSGIEYTMMASSIPVAFESVYDLLSFSKAIFRTTGYYQLDPNVQQTNGRAGTTTNFVGISSGLYYGGFTGLSKYKDWTVKNYEGRFNFVSGSAQIPFDIVSLDITHFWSQDGLAEGNVLGISAGIDVVPFILAVKSGATNSIVKPGTLHHYRQENGEWPNWWDGQDLLRSLEQERNSGALLPMRARAIVQHNAREWERLEEWQKIHSGQVVKIPSAP